MSALAGARTPLIQARPTLLPFQLEIATSLSAIESEWREFEQQAVTSPYSRYDWVSAFATAAASSSVLAAIARDAAGTAFLLPFERRRRLGLTLGFAVGGKHANSAMPLMRPDIYARLQSEDAARLLREVGRAAGLDAVVLPQVPRDWAGRENPVAAGAPSSPSEGWALRLDPDPDTALARSMSAHARKALKKKLRGLGRLGPVDTVRAGTSREAELILDAFLSQKRSRARETGTPDPFAAPEIERILRAATVAGLDRKAPPVELYGLRVSGEFVATFGGAGDANRLSGMFLSFANGPAAPFSPGEILVVEIIRSQHGTGREWFDLGVGDARYKRTICDTVERLADVTVPVTAAGRGFALARHAASSAKGRLKRSPAVMAFLSRARKGLAGRAA